MPYIKCTEADLKPGDLFYHSDPADDQDDLLFLKRLEGVQHGHRIVRVYNHLDGSNHLDRVPSEFWGEIEVWVVVEREAAPSIWDLVKIDVAKRSSEECHPGGLTAKDPLLAAYEEALDLVSHLRLAIYERDQK